MSRVMLQHLLHSVEVMQVDEKRRKDTFVLSLAYSPDGKWLLAAVPGSARRLQLWSLPEARQAYFLHLGTAAALCACSGSWDRVHMCLSIEALSHRCVPQASPDTDNAPRGHAGGQQHPVALQQ